MTDGANKVLVIQGHPDPAAGHFDHALADAYAEGAAAAGHEVRRIDVAALDFGFVRSKDDWGEGEVAADIRAAQGDIEWAEHIVFVYPLWLGTMPAILKAFLEQVMRPGFALGDGFKKLLKGRSARVIVTMGMPALAYRWFFRAHSLKSFERNILKFVGISPVRETLIGLVEAPDAGKRTKWLERMRALGRDAA